jgi:DNA (cytosine-5)-methyltransferase 1
MSRAPFSFYEFFAGGGMARLGLGAGWACAFANDFDRRRPTGSPTSAGPE